MFVKLRVRGLSRLYECILLDFFAGTSAEKGFWVSNGPNTLRHSFSCSNESSWFLFESRFKEGYDYQGGTYWYYRVSCSA